jgi:hypothetical protein
MPRARQHGRWHQDYMQPVRRWGVAGACASPKNVHTHAAAAQQYGRAARQPLGAKGGSPKRAQAPGHAPCGPCRWTSQHPQSSSGAAGLTSANRCGGGRGGRRGRGKRARHMHTKGAVVSIHAPARWARTRGSAHQPTTRKAMMHAHAEGEQQAAAAVHAPPAQAVPLRPSPPNPATIVAGDGKNYLSGWPRVLCVWQGPAGLGLGAPHAFASRVHRFLLLHLRSCMQAACAHPLCAPGCLRCPAGLLPLRAGGPCQPCPAAAVGGLRPPGLPFAARRQRAVCIGVCVFWGEVCEKRTLSVRGGRPRARGVDPPILL